MGAATSQVVAEGGFCIQTPKRSLARRGPEQQAFCKLVLTPACACRQPSALRPLFCKASRPFVSSPDLTITGGSWNTSGPGLRGQAPLGPWRWIIFLLLDEHLLAFKKAAPQGS